MRFFITAKTPNAKDHRPPLETSAGSEFQRELGKLVNPLYFLVHLPHLQAAFRQHLYRLLTPQALNLVLRRMNNVCSQTSTSRGRTSCTLSRPGAPLFHQMQRPRALSRPTQPSKRAFLKAKTLSVPSQSSGGMPFPPLSTKDPRSNTSAIQTLNSLTLDPANPGLFNYGCICWLRSNTPFKVRLPMCHALSRISSNS
jgi:hypothetical protein